MRRLVTGRTPPLFNNARIISCSPYGDLHVELDLDYRGSLLLEFETTATLNLGASLNAVVGAATNGAPITVDILVRVQISSIRGRIALRSNPHPATRLWWGFTAEPEMQVVVEPFAGANSRVSFAMVKEVFERRIAKGVRDALVWPNVEDLSVFGCEGGNVQWEVRGGEASRVVASATAGDGIGSASVIAGKSSQSTSTTPIPRSPNVANQPSFFDHQQQLSTFFDGTSSGLASITVTSPPQVHGRTRLFGSFSGPAVAATLSGGPAMTMASSLMPTGRSPSLASNNSSNQQLSGSSSLYSSMESVANVGSGSSTGSSTGNSTGKTGGKSAGNNALIPSPLSPEAHRRTPFVSKALASFIGASSGNSATGLFGRPPLSPGKRVRRMMNPFQEDAVSDGSVEL